MAGLTWLHLSDWHQKGADFDRQVVRDALIRDIRKRVAIDPGLTQLDFMVFSGDLAFSGKSDEYEAARVHLLDKVSEAGGLARNRIFIVPGNHDLNRAHIREMLPRALQKPLATDQEVQTWLTDDRKRARLLEPFEAFSTFVRGYTGQEPPDYANILWLEADGKRVALLGLNSAWMCARRPDQKNPSEVDDYGCLVLGEPQVHEALERAAGADLRIVVMHHPFDFMPEFDRTRVEERLTRAAHFILRGHQHIPQVNVATGSGGECVIIPAGASYKRRIPEDPRYTNAYNFAHLDFETERGTVHLRRWSDRRNEWVEDTDTYPGGRFKFALPKGVGESLAASTPPVSQQQLSQDALTEARRLTAENRYRDIMLETCDIISLANLPEQDRHLAQRQLELRRLYVPLRVWIETSVDEQSEDKKWQDLEKRRTEAMRGILMQQTPSPREEGQPRSDERQRQRVSVGECLTKSQRLVVLGDPGAGKTTLVRWIATAYLLRLKHYPAWQALPDVSTLPDREWLPIIIRCRDLDVDCLNGSLDDILQHTLRKAEMYEREATDLLDLLRARLKAGQAILMLDGLDEISDPVARACLCQQLDQVVVAYPDAPIIATSRIVGYREMGYKLSRGFVHLTLADLTPEEKDDFAHRWCSLTEAPERRAIATEGLIHDIHSADRIERLTSNPMLLTTMALVKRKIGQLPGRRADLYWEAVQVLLNWRREVDEPLDWREAIPQLEYLAYAMCDQGVQQLRQDQVLDLFARMRDEYPNIHATRNRTPEAFLKRIEARTGILVEVGYERHLGILAPLYEFRHLTFQEYLAARALVDGRFPNRNVQRSLAENAAPLAGRTVEATSTEGGDALLVASKDWREALRLCAAICSDDDVDGVIHAILEPQSSEPPITERSRAVLAALCLADEPNVSKDIARQALQAFARQVGEDDGSGGVETEVDAAAMELSGTRWAEPLRDALLAEYWERKPPTRLNPGGLAAMLSTAALPEDAARLTDWLVDQTLQLRTTDERDATGVALTIMDLAFRGKAHPVAGLVETLLRRLNGTAPLSCAAAWALAWLNGGRDPNVNGVWELAPTDVDSLVACLANPDSDPYAVRFLTWILRREQVESAAAWLAPWLTNSFAEVRVAVAQALGGLKDEGMIEALLCAIEDTESTVRSAVARALGSIKNERALESLLSRLEDSEARVRSAAAWSLGKIGSERAVASLLSHLEDPEPSVRSAAAQALGEIESSLAVPPLLLRLEDSESSVRGAAAEALGAIESELAIDLLISHLEDPEVSVRTAAARALGDIESDRALQPLVAHLDDSDAGVRTAAIRALGEIGNECAVDLLLARLQDAEASMRSAAAWALGKIKSEKAAETLLCHAHDSEVDVRSAVVWALGNMTYKPALEPLLASLDDPEAEVRREAAQALGRIRSQRAVESLLVRLADTESGVRSEVVWALGEIKHGRAVESLRACLKDPKADVRSAAARALGRLNDEHAEEALVASLEDAKADVRSAAASALSRTKNKQTEDALIACLKDSRADVRSATALALGRLKSERAVDGFVTCLEDVQASVRRAGAWALGEIKGERAVECLLAHLEDKQPSVRSAVVLALGEIKGKDAINSLFALLEDHVVMVRREAILTLCRILSGGRLEGISERSPGWKATEDDWEVMSWLADSIEDAADVEQVLTPLLARLADTRADVRGYAALALGFAKSKRATAPLLTRLEDPEAIVRALTAVALGLAKSHSAIETLLVCLEDTHYEARLGAAFGLGNIGAETAVSPLLDHLRDVNAEVRSASAWALGRIRSERAVKDLTAHLRDTSRSVQRAAASALGCIKSESATDALLAYLNDSDEDTRRAVLGGLAQSLEKTDRELLSSDLDGAYPFLDLQEPIGKDYVQKAAKTSGLSEEVIRAHYQTMQRRFGLRLSWQDTEQ